jgi:hypothetical protein
MGVERFWGDLGVEGGGTDFVLHPYVVGWHMVGAVGHQEDAGR